MKYDKDIVVKWFAEHGLTAVSESRMCNAPACDRPRNAHGLCDMHLYWLKHHGNLDWRPIKGTEQMCKHCGNVFIAGRIGNVYCSRKCGMAAWQATATIRFAWRQEMRTCGICSKSFTPTTANQLHCSTDCTYEKRKKTIRTAHGETGKGWSAGKEFVRRQSCERCGLKFYAPPVLLRRGGGRFCSVKCRAMTLNRRPLGFPEKMRRSKPGKRTDLNGQYFRSAWEANYARYLNWLIATKQIDRWEYEPDTFEFHKIKRGSRFYTPDFKVFEIDGSSYAYHEVKGYMDAKSQTKLKRMKRYYPKERLIVIDKDAYKSLAAQFKRALPNWE